MHLLHIDEFYARMLKLFLKTKSTSSVKRLSRNCLRTLIVFKAARLVQSLCSASLDSKSLFFFKYRSHLGIEMITQELHGLQLLGHRADYANIPTADLSKLRIPLISFTLSVQHLYRAPLYHFHLSLRGHPEKCHKFPQPHELGSGPRHLAQAVCFVGAKILGFSHPHQCLHELIPGEKIGFDIDLWYLTSKSVKPSVILYDSFIDLCDPLSIH